MSATEARILTTWFDECDGFSQGTDAPHKWVLQADSELRRLSEQVESAKQIEAAAAMKLGESLIKIGTLEEQLAALAEQNEKMRDALGWHPGNYKLNDEDRKHINEALSLPNLATPVLNKLKAEAYREAANELADDGGEGYAKALLRAKAAELEQSK